MSRAGRRARARERFRIQQEQRLARIEQERVTNDTTAEAADIERLRQPADEVAEQRINMGPGAQASEPRRFTQMSRGQRQSPFTQSGPVMSPESTNPPLSGQVVSDMKKKKNIKAGKKEMKTFLDKLMERKRE